MKKLEDYSSVEDLREDLFLDYNELSNGIFNLTNWLECLHLARGKYGDTLPEDGKIGCFHTITVKEIYGHLDAACEKLRMSIQELRKAWISDNELQQINTK